MFRTLAAVLFGFSTMFMSGQTLAACPSPQPVGTFCCTYDNVLNKPAVITRYATGWGVVPAVLSNNGNTELVSSVAQCRANANLTAKTLYPRTGCNTIPPTPVPPATDYPPVSTIDPGLTTTNPDGSVVGYQGVKNVFPVQWYTGTSGSTQPCMTAIGKVYWTVSPSTIPCPQKDLNPKPGDACSRELEKSFGTLATPTVCPVPAKNVMNDLAGEPCFRRKLAELGITYTVPTATYRSIAYQNHLADLWGKHHWHTWPARTAEELNACAVQRAVVLAEQNGPPAPGHRLGFPPSGMTHSGNAFDIDGGVVDQLRASRPNIQEYLDAPAAGLTTCKLQWGGIFGDKYHFTLK